jgi:hypothetical protein
MRTLTLLVLAISFVSIAAAGPCTAGAGVWNEQAYGGDAGKLPGTADITTGEGAVNLICGNLGDATGGGDMFEIYITGSGFSAITADRNGSTLNPSLYLFDSSGDPIAGENDISGGNDQAQLAGLTLTPGLYYILIVPNDQEPEHGGNLLFTDFDGSTDTQSPTLDRTVNGFNNDGDSSGEYTIALTDAEFASQTPEPATFGLAGLGLLALASALRHRRA